MGSPGAGAAARAGRGWRGRGAEGRGDPWAVGRGDGRENGWSHHRPGRMELDDGAPIAVCGVTCLVED